MRFLILVASVLIAVSAVSVKDQWQDFKLKHGKSYKSIAEETRRFAIFQSNVQKIEQHNIKYENGESGYKMGINKFADKTIAELRAQLLAPNMTRPKSDKTFHASMVNAADVPDSIDWTEKGAVTEVKDQGDCGSCFAFSSTGAIEGAHFLKTNELINLSEQDVVDCTTSYGNGACDGGLSMYVYQYAKDHGLAKLSDYPYTGVQGSCQNNGIGYVFVDSYVDVSPDEDSLKAAVGSIGPISVSLYADDVFYYESGIFDDQSCGKELDHEIVMVGYGSENGKDYWRGKNSWGTGWGESGYVRFARNANDICGIADMSTYPIL